MAEKSQQSKRSTRATSTRPQGVRMSKAVRQQAQDTFIASYRLNANKTAACMQANIDYTTLLYWEEHDEEFSVRLHLADKAANDMLLGAAWRRGVQGVEEPVVSMGTQVYVDGKPLMKRVYSDTVLLRLMSWRIAGFRESSPGTTINNVNLQMQRNEIYANMQDEELDQLEQLWNKAQERLQRGGK